MIRAVLSDIGILLKSIRYLVKRWFLRWLPMNPKTRPLALDEHDKAHARAIESYTHRA